MRKPKHCPYPDCRSGVLMVDTSDTSGYRAKWYWAHLNACHPPAQIQPQEMRQMKQEFVVCSAWKDLTGG